MEYKLEFIETVGKIVVFMLILLSFFLFTVKTTNKLSNRLFGIYLLLIAFDLIGFITSKTIDYPIIYNLKMVSSLLQLPLFYLYVLSACYSNFKINKKHSVHFLLFLVFFIVFYTTNFSSQAILAFKIVGEIQFWIYIFAIFIALTKYKAVYLENYSNANYAIYRWLFQITVISCVAHTFVILKWYLSNSKFQEYILNINILISFSVLSITIFFVLRALYQPKLFTGININLSPVKSLLVNEETKKDISIENENIQKLTYFMEKEKPYLDFELTLQKLAIQTAIPEKELSILINHHLNKHFFDFINEYRINDAKKLLTDPTKKELTVLEILYEVGFNSKSSFYTAFKKITYTTPLEFRKSVS